MAKISDPFANRIPSHPVIPGQPPRFTPGLTSPLAGNAARQSEAHGVNVRPVEEQTRATGLPRQIDSGQAAPRFGDRPAPAPFPAAGDRAAQPAVPAVRPRIADSRSK